MGRKVDAAAKYVELVGASSFVSHAYGGPEQWGVGAPLEVQLWLCHSGADAEEKLLLKRLAGIEIGLRGAPHRFAGEDVRLSALRLAPLGRRGEAAFCSLKDFEEKYWISNRKYAAPRKRTALRALLSSRGFVHSTVFGPHFDSCVFTIVHCGSLMDERVLKRELEEIGIGRMDSVEMEHHRGFVRMIVHGFNDDGCRALAGLGTRFENRKYSGPRFDKA